MMKTTSRGEPELPMPDAFMPRPTGSQQSTPCAIRSAGRARGKSGTTTTCARPKRRSARIGRTDRRIAAGVAAPQPAGMRRHQFSAQPAVAQE